MDETDVWENHTNENRAGRTCRVLHFGRFHSWARLAGTAQGDRNSVLERATSCAWRSRFFVSSLRFSAKSSWSQDRSSRPLERRETPRISPSQRASLLVRCCIC